MINTKIISILTSIGILFITLVIIIFSINIKIHEPAILYVKQNETHLIIDNTKKIDSIKNFTRFTITSLKTKKESVFYKKNTNTEVNNDLIVLKNNKDFSIGVYKVLVYIGSASFAKHYLNI